MPLRLLLVVCLCLSLPSEAQQTGTPSAQTLQRDSQALSLVQESLAAMGSAQAILLKDCVATGQAETFLPDGTTLTLPITKKSKGTKMVRTELQRPEGTQVRIVNSGVGGIRDSNGVFHRNRSNSIVGERVEHIPALSILAEWQSPDTEIRYVGADSLNGAPVQVVELSFIPTSDPRSVASYRSITQTRFYLDQTTKLVFKLEYENFAEGDSNRSEKIEVFFADYRPISGVLVPFTETTYADEHARSKLIFTSFAFNVGLADSEFAGAGGN